MQLPQINTVAGVNNINSCNKHKFNDFADKYRIGSRPIIKNDEGDLFIIQQVIL